MEKNPVCVEKNPVKMEKIFAWIPTIGVQREAGLGWQGLRVATGAPCTLSHLAGVGG
jgi:hypothetical protein